VVLTYVLKVLSEDGLKDLAFKGGTCLKKMHFGGSGRFSMDLDFTSLNISIDDLQAKLKALLNKRSHFGIEFRISEENIRKATSYNTSINRLKTSFGNNVQIDKFLRL
jgi:predicted nucleotidyltransferase component of viral defense system